MRSRNHRRAKSIAVRLMVSINWPKRMSQMNPISWFLIPTSTMDWVRNGSTSCRALPASSPKTIKEKVLRYFFTDAKRKRKGRFSLMFSSPCIL